MSEILDMSYEKWTTEHITKLIEENNYGSGSKEGDELILKIASHPNTSDAWLEDFCLSGVQPITVIIEVAKNPSLDEDLLDELIDNPDIRVKLSVISHPSCTINILKDFALSEKHPIEVIKAIISNPKCDQELLNELYQKEKNEDWEQIDELISNHPNYLGSTDKQPLQLITIYTIPSGEDYGRIAAGVVTIDIIIDAICSNCDSWDDYIWNELDSIFDFDSFYSADGFFDGGSEVIINSDTGEEFKIGNIKGDTEIPNIVDYAKNLPTGTFFHQAVSHHDGEYGDFTLEIGRNLDPQSIIEIWENGLHVGYDPYMSFDINVSESDYDKEYHLYKKTTDGIKEVYLEDLKGEIIEKVGNIDDQNVIKNYFASKHNS